MMTKKHLYPLIALSLIILTNCSKTNEKNESGEITDVGIGSISEEVMPDYVPPIGKQASVVEYSKENSHIPLDQQIGYTISYGEEVNHKKNKLGEVTRPLKQSWKYRLLAYDPQTGNKVGDITYIRGQENPNTKMELTVGKTYTFVCYSVYNTSQTNNNGAPNSLPPTNSDNINTAEITGIDGGASFMFWKETRAVHHGLKLNINLRHQFHGYEVTIKAPANHTFSITNGNNGTQGARIYPSLAFVDFKISDMNITRAITNSNTSSNNPAAVNNDFIALMNTQSVSNYVDPYTKLGRAIRFVAPNNPNTLWEANTNNIFVTQLSCLETSFLTNVNSSAYNTYKSVMRIHEIALRRVSDGKTTSIQVLFIPYIDMQRRKMNRITINLIAPSGF